MNLSHKTRCSVILLICVLIVSAGAVGADEGIDRMRRKISSFTGKLVRMMEGDRVGEKGLTVAVMPLAESGRKLYRGLGRRAANTVVNGLVNGAPEWVSVQDRMNLPSIFEEHKLWVEEIVKENQQRAAPQDLIKRAEMLVIGTTVRRRKEVDINLRFVVARTGSIKAAESFEVDLTPEVRALLPFVDGKDIEDDIPIATVSNIQLTVKAQRAAALEGRVEEWTLEDGDTLRGGDQFNVRFVPDADACVYIYMYGSGGNASLLYPPSDWKTQFQKQYGRKIAQQNYYCRAEWPYLAPGTDAKGRELFYKLDETPGENYMYVCARRKKVPDVSNIKRRLGRLGDHDRRVRMLRGIFDYVEVFQFRQK